MKQRLIEVLLDARKSVKHKYISLKRDFALAERKSEQHLKPITQPLKQLLTKATPQNFKRENIKHDSADVTSSTETLLRTPLKASTAQRIPKTLFSEHEEQPSFLDTSVIADTTRDDETPTLDELRAELSRAGDHPSFTEFLDQYDGLAKIYVEQMFRSTENEFDHRYGVRYIPEANKFYVGDSELDFDKQDLVLKLPTGDTVAYNGTPGLYELLFKRQPLGYKTADENNYRDILLRTNAIRRHYNPNEQIQGTGKKYSSIIKPLFSTRVSVPRIQTSSVSTRKGKGIQMLQLNNKRIEFMPWSNPNKLVNWLRVLLGSQSAGNTNNHNEIIYIIDELRNAEIIK
ncbi:uncharacterized protein LOC116182740 [Photinus pyralis]|uniref:uncharacterized protein LOC116182740 n=1 Tax=Photinus pyralis TaxID=7054 RepID=UPI00126764FC|nr:uncharacterized protein LOC116182740 [Photinus pyralis]